MEVLPPGMNIVEPSNPKAGKKRESSVSHQKVGSMHEAARLEGKVKNVGIKNLGHQKKKGKK